MTKGGTDVPTIEGIDPTIHTIGTVFFVLIIAAYSAFSYINGRKVPAKVETKEFALAGQLADMGPVKELIEQTGLVFQQAVRTNMHLEAHTKKQGQTALAIQSLAKQVGRLADAYEAHMADEQREREIDEEVERRIRERGK